MKNSFQVDGRRRSVFATCLALSPVNADFSQYEKHVGIRGEFLTTGTTSTVSCLFGQSDIRVLYLYKSSAGGRPALAAAALAYSPDTPEEMLGELLEYAGLKETDDVPGGFMERFVRVLRATTEEETEMPEAKL